MRDGLEVPSEIVVASYPPWPDPPEGVRVLVTGAILRYRLFSATVFCQSDYGAAFTVLQAEARSDHAGT
jgi:hypothetical protein